MVKSKSFRDWVPSLESLALPHTNCVILCFIFLLCASVSFTLKWWLYDLHHGVSVKNAEIKGVKCLEESLAHSTTQVLAIFITYYNANFLNKAHLFITPLNPIPQSQFNYSLFSTELRLHNFIHFQISDFPSKEEAFPLARKDSSSVLAARIVWI